MRNLPNLLTLVRIFLVPLLVAALLEHQLRISWGNTVVIANDFLALILFLAAALTDLLDGYLARRWKQVTTVGTLLDPIADKLLVSAALISMVETKMLPAWLVILIISREFAVSGLRSIAATEGIVIKAGELGKSKMVLEVVGIVLMMVSDRWHALKPISLYTMWAVVFFAVVSAGQYFWKFWKGLDINIKQRRRRELLALDRQKRRLEMAEKREVLKRRPAIHGPAKQ